MLRAVDGVSFDIARGETLALVGESGCGKSTVARMLVGLYGLTRGDIRFDGQPLAGMAESGGRAMRKRLQMIFQDPYASLNPRWRVGRIIAEPMLTHTTMTPAERTARVGQLLKQVGWIRPTRAAIRTSSRAASASASRSRARWRSIRSSWSATSRPRRWTCRCRRRC